VLLTSPAWITRLVGRFQRAGLAVAVGPYVFLGAVLWGLALISPLPYVRWNETCLILLPTDVLLVAFLSPERRRKYARFRVGMLGLLAVLEVIGLVKAPLLAPILWPLIPAAVVGFWPPAAPAAAAAAPAAEPAPAPAASKGAGAGKGTGSGSGKNRKRR
jgi:hypothetical protein